MTRVLQRPGLVGVEADLDLERQLDLGGVAALLLDALADGGQQLVGVQLGRLAAGRDEPVADPTGEPRGRRPGRGDVQRNAAVGAVIDGRVVGLEVLARERHALGGPELDHQQARLLEHLEAHLLLGPVDTERHLVHRLPGADPEEHPPRVQAAQRAHRLGHDPRVIAIRRRHHARPQPDPLGALPDRRQPGERERRMPAVVAPGLEVIGDDDAVEAELLGQHGVLHELARRELLGRRLVAEPHSRDGSPR